MPVQLAEPPWPCTNIAWLQDSSWWLCRGWQSQGIQKEAWVGAPNSRGSSWDRGKSLHSRHSRGTLLKPQVCPPSKKNTLVGWLPSPSYTHTPWQWPSGSSGMSSDASPFLSGLRGLSCPDLGIWGQWSLKFPQPLIPCKLQVLQHQRSERQSGLGMTPRPAEN